MTRDLAVPRQHLLLDPTCSIKQLLSRERWLVTSTIAQEQPHTDLIFKSIKSTKDGGMVQIENTSSA